MSMKALIFLLVAALAAAGWYFRDTAMVGGIVRDVEKMLDSVRPASGVRADKNGKAIEAGKTDSSKKAAGGLRKCVAGEKITYTDEACPPGSRESAISGGNVTVLPAQRGAPAETDKAGKAAAAPPEAARVKEELSMREKRMEQTVNR